MKKSLIASMLLAGFTSIAVQAQDATPPAPASDTSTTNHGGWSGSGEFGLSSTTGNTRSQNIDAKLTLNQENEQWKNNFFGDLLQTKAQQSVVDASGNTIYQFNKTANRYDGGASVGYKLDPRSYVVGAGRYDHDEFGANLWQGTVSIGYGYIALKDERNELSFEIGPGYTRYRPADVLMAINDVSVSERQPTVGEVVARGLVNYKYKLTANASIEDTFLTEAGSKNTYIQDDAGLSVTVTKKLALKVGFQIRHNSSVLAGVKKSDTLTTTNLVYNF